MSLRTWNTTPISIDGPQGWDNTRVAIRGEKYCPWWLTFLKPDTGEVFDFGKPCRSFSHQPCAEKRVKRLLQHKESVPEHFSCGGHPKQIARNRVYYLARSQIGRQLNNRDLIGEVLHYIHGLAVENDAVPEAHVVTAEVYLGGMSSGRIDAVENTRHTGIQPVFPVEPD